MKARLIWEGKITITEKEGVELTDKQCHDIIEAMNSWLSYHFPHGELENISPHSELVNVEATGSTSKAALYLGRLGSQGGRRSP